MQRDLATDGVKNALAGLMTQYGLPITGLEAGTVPTHPPPPQTGNMYGSGSDPGYSKPSYQGSSYGGGESYREGVHGYPYPLSSMAGSSYGDTSRFGEGSGSHQNMDSTSPRFSHKGSARSRDSMYGASSGIVPSGGNRLSGPPPYSHPIPSQGGSWNYPPSTR